MNLLDTSKIIFNIIDFLMTKNMLILVSYPEEVPNLALHIICFDLILRLSQLLLMSRDIVSFQFDPWKWVS